ncbi:hypothetical protein DWUX_864 [Desulfovibrio diazotrophicus]|nr:hypothetical protein DWUX_864 [Desulfovibrio diazotrophicus]
MQFQPRGGALFLQVLPCRSHCAVFPCAKVRIFGVRPPV